jgi:Tfp pilus assembly PilM family ATPase
MYIIALEFEQDRILVAAARQSGRQLQIHSAFSLLREADDDQRLADRIKEELSQRGIKATTTIVVIPRSSVEIRELNLPPAPDNELPEMVRFLARNEFAALNDNWLLDFVPSSKDENIPRKVLASGLSPDRHKQIVNITERAGLKVKHIVLRPFESLGLMQTSLTEGRCSLIVDLDIEQVDMIVSFGSNVVATRTVRIPSSATDRVKNLFLEVKRTAASTTELLNGKEINEVIIVGDTADDQPLKETIEDKLQIPVRLIKPFDLVRLPANFPVPEEPARYSALLGSLLQQAHQTPHTLDFLNPRKPIIRKDGRRRALQYGGLAAGLLLLASLFGFWTLYNQKREITNLTGQLAKAEQRNRGDDKRPGVDQITGEVRKIDDWMFSDVNWLEEMVNLTGRMETPDDTITDLFHGQLRGGKPEISIRGRLVEKVQRTLVSALEERPYDVRPNKWDPEDDDPNYPLPFDFRLGREIDPDLKLQQLDQIAEQLFQSRIQERMKTSGPAASPDPDSAPANPSGEQTTR